MCVKNRNTHHVEEDVESVRVPCVGRDEADKGDKVDPGRLDNDCSFFRKTERPARVTHRGLAHPDAKGDEHCSKHKREG